MKRKSVRALSRSAVLMIVVLGAAVGPALAAEFYRVTISRLDRNLYRDDASKTLIETRYCYEYAHRDDAVLRWEGRIGTNKLIFSSRTSCDVVALR